MPNARSPKDSARSYGRPTNGRPPTRASCAFRPTLKQSWTTTELTARLINSVSDTYAVDTNRIYGTGQSMGCMTTLILASEYPDLYAACMFVDGQWDVSTLSGLENQTFVYFAAEDDERAFAGQQEVMAMFDADNASYTYQQWDAAWNAEQLTDAAAGLTAHWLLRIFGLLEPRRHGWRKRPHGLIRLRLQLRCRHGMAVPAVGYLETISAQADESGAWPLTHFYEEVSQCPGP